MTDGMSMDALQERIDLILSADTDDFLELGKILGRDPLRDLAGHDLSNVDLHGKDLQGANFTGTKFRYADLSETNLSRASLWGADLTGANLRGADLSGANLTKADLSDTDCIDIISDGDTIWPTETEQGYVLHHAPCSVLTVHRDTQSDQEFQDLGGQGTSLVDRKYPLN